jgi:hypothetical protein
VPEPDAPSRSLTFSVLIGLVSTEDSSRILETLEALRRQQGTHTYEVVIGDRRNDGISQKIEKNYPEAKLIPRPPQASLPELRTAALDRSSGQYIIVTEDHCVPPDDWLDSVARAFRTAPPGTVAVGGCVENGVHDTALDWATFFCEYSFFLAPVTEGVSKVLPGMNVAYDRAIFQNLDRSLLTRGFWETTVHPVLLKAGKTLFSTSSIKLVHCKKFSFSLFARQRFIYSRYYAGLRFGRGQLAPRAIALAATPILPVLLFYRIFKQISTKNRLRSELMSALPMLAIFVVIWAWGEMVGYALGAGDALARIE